jgi:caffeoyl-CoA O-methyltransferase
MINAAKNKTVRPVTPWGILVEQIENLLTASKRELVSAQFQTQLEDAYQLAAGLDP